MPCEPRVVVFTDVEVFAAGARRRHDSVARTLADIGAKGVPLVFSSTRTRAEIQAVQRSLRCRHPFVCENGAAVVIPAGYFGGPVPEARRVGRWEVVAFGRPYADVVRTLVEGAASVGVAIRGFHEMSLDEIAAAYGCSRRAAERARRREYAEPFRILSPDDDARTRLRAALAVRGVGLSSGGRFDCAGPLVDEGAGIGTVRRLYERAVGPVLAVGFGDALADEALLDHVDVPITALGTGRSGRSTQIAKAHRGATMEHRVRRGVYEQMNCWHPMPALRM